MSFIYRSSADAPAPTIESSAAPDSPRAPKRLTWIDSVRGLGILLVVVGHTLRGLTASEILPNTPLWSFVDRFIYAFHMPLFFFVAGLFLLPSSRESYTDFAHRRLLRLGYPYLLWGGLQTLSQVLLSRYTNHTIGLEGFLSLGFQPPMQFWFLYALFLQTLFLGLLAKLGLKRGAVLGVALLIFATIPLVPIGQWSPLNQARNYLIYTALGVFFGAADRIAALDRGKTWIYSLLLLGYPLVGYAVWHGEIPREQHWLTVGVAIVGSVASLGACVLLSRARQPVAELCARTLVLWGEASMAIFVAHTLASAAVRIGLVNVLDVRNAALHLTLGTVLGIAVPWLLYLLSKRLAFPYLFEWPSRASSVKPAADRSSQPSIGSPAT